jgi:RimJ/RimL family protein N-acetyltransferase
MSGTVDRDVGPAVGAARTWSMPSLAPIVLPAGRLSSGPQPVLTTTDGWVLRPWNAADAPVVLAAFADPAIRHWNCRSMASGNEARDWIRSWSQAWAEERDASWAVVDPGLRGPNAGTGLRGPNAETGTEAVLGRVALRDIRRDTGQAEVSYWVLPAARGRGVAAGAVDAVSRWAFTTIGFQRLHIVHAVENGASCRAATRADFALEGTLRRYQLLADGWHDVHLHARINGDGPGRGHPDRPLPPVRPGYPGPRPRR